VSDIVRWLRDSQHHNEKLRTTVSGASEAAEFYQRGADEIVRLRELATDMDELLRDGRIQYVAGTPADLAWDIKRERVLNSDVLRSVLDTKGEST
jgi:hypothetical protein